MDKPTMKREVSVSFAGTCTKIIGFYATKDAAEDIRGFGRMEYLGEDEYQLVVDTRFDFDEVVSYIQNYG